MKRLLLAVLIASGAARAEQMAFLTTVDDAKKAAAGKKPIAVILTQKGCPATAEFVKNFLKDDRVAALFPGFAWLSVEVGSPVYKDWFVKTFGETVNGTPALVFLNPKGENADPDYAGLPTLSTSDMNELVPVLREVWQRSKQDELPKDKDAVKAAQDKVAAAKTPGERIAAWNAVLRAGDGWHAEEKAVKEARTGIEKTLQEGSAEMLRIYREVRDPEEQKKAFEKVKAEYAGTSVADWANEEAAKVKTKK